MIDMNNMRWHLSNQEKSAFLWLDQHGFDIFVEYQDTKKTGLVVKRRTAARFTIPRDEDTPSVLRRLEQFEKDFDVA